MKPELREVVLGLIIAGSTFAIVLAIAGVHHPADFAAPGLKFVSPGISIPSRRPTKSALAFSAQATRSRTMSAPDDRHRLEAACVNLQVGAVEGLD